MSARRNVKRAQRLGLVTKFEDDERFVDEHYEQLKEVYRRGGSRLPFGKQRVLEFSGSSRRAANLVAVSVYLPGGRVNIATGIFTIEGSELLLWMWRTASTTAGTAHELMTWTVMQRAIQQGCETFDRMGRGDFKTKFGRARPAESALACWGGIAGWMAARKVAKRAYGWPADVARPGFAR